MPNTPFVGKLLIENTTTQIPTVTIDGDGGELALFGPSPTSTDPHQAVVHLRAIDATIRAGLAGADGHMLVLGDDGKVKISLASVKEPTGTEGELALFSSSATSSDPHQAVVHLRASDATIRAGLAGADGHVLVLGDDGKVKVSLSSVKESAGTEGELALFSPSATSSDPQQAVVHLRASDATIRAGLAGADGHVLVIGNDGKVKVSLSSVKESAGTEGELALFSPSATSSDPQQAVVHLRASDATIRAGLAGADGHVLVIGNDGKVKASLGSVEEGLEHVGELALFAPSATSSDPHQAVIHLRANDATIRAGLAGVADGFILVSGKDGKNTIKIEGSSGDIILSNADCAEEFDVVEPGQIEPGTVMVFDEDGKICKSSRAYDRKVAGIISGAGDYKPAIVLDRRRSSETRMPIALLGKVYCNVDAEAAPIEVGDLLTTSDTPGHAMKACDSLKAFGAVLGKALRPLASGRGLIPVLVAMQ